jgi:hypothetical protein
MPESKPKPQFEFLLTGDKKSWQLRRGDSVVLEHVIGEPMENFMVRLCDYMNRDRRPVVYLEDRIISLRGLIDNAAEMLDILYSRLKAASKQDKATQANVKLWVAKAKQFTEEIRKEAA